jgi:octaprenyl-diphosphate synthase
MHGLTEANPGLRPLAEFLAGTLERVASRVDGHLSSELSAVEELCRHVAQYRGKMLRPTLVVLSGLATHPRAREWAPERIIGEPHVTLAAVVEMVHMATLVHDDVLDEAETRRRGPSVNRLHGNEAAVMLGDYLLAGAYHLCSTLPTTGPALAVGRASMILCAGELLQLNHRGDFSLDEETYHAIIDRKTAELIALSASLGAAEAGATPRAAGAMESFARQIGRAFQIQDDLLDLLGESSVIGKPAGKDAALGKMTLPLIHHLAKAPARLRGRTLRALERLPRADARAEIVANVRETGSVEHARGEAMGLVARAKAELEGLASTPAREMLRVMADAVVARES